MYLQDKVLVVSGVGPDLGRQIAVRGAAAGADVVLAARTASRLEEVAKEIADTRPPGAGRADRHDRAG